MIHYYKNIDYSRHTPSGSRGGVDKNKRERESCGGVKSDTHTHTQKGLLLPVGGDFLCVCFAMTHTLREAQAVNLDF